MVLEFATGEGVTAEEMVRTLRDSVQRALDGQGAQQTADEGREEKTILENTTDLTEYTYSKKVVADVIHHPSEYVPPEYLKNDDGSIYYPITSITVDPDTYETKIEYGDPIVLKAGYWTEAWDEEILEPRDFTFEVESKVNVRVTKYGESDRRVDALLRVTLTEYNSEELGYRVVPGTKGMFGEMGMFHEARIIDNEAMTEDSNTDHSVCYKELSDVSFRVSDEGLEFKPNTSEFSLEGKVHHGIIGYAVFDAHVYGYRVE